MNKQLRSTLLLILGSVIWGCAFVAQSVGMDHIGPFAFNAIRSLIGTLVLLPCIGIRDRYRNRKGLPPTGPKTRQERRLFLRAVLLCGTALFGATMFQQVGLVYTSVGKAGFITAMYIILVPVFGMFLKYRTGVRIWFCVAIAVLGLYFLCIKEGFSVGKGDLMMLGAAMLFAVQILLISRFAPHVDSLRLSAGQFLVSGVLSLIVMAFTEAPTVKGIFGAWASLLYAGVLSSGVAYTLQIVGERDADPAIASLAMSMESVFSLLAGWILLHQVLSGRELTGCALMFAAIVISQLPGKNRKESS